MIGMVGTRFLDGLMDQEHVALVQDLLLRFWNALDQRDYGGMLSLTAENCAWQRDGVGITGRKEILAMLNARPTNRHSRHLVTNLRITGDGNMFSADYVFIAFVHDAQAGEKTPYPVALPHLIANMLTKGRYNDDSATISLINAQPLFTFQPS